jgi:hypothetical protein
MGNKELAEHYFLQRATSEDFEQVSRSLVHKCGAIFTPSAGANWAGAESARSAELGAWLLLGWFVRNGIIEMSQ